MREPEGQIENSGYRVRKHLGQMLLLGPLINGQLLIARHPNRSAGFGFSWLWIQLDLLDETE
jgi:hypothetical protein